MNLTVKPFDELTLEEYHELLVLRCAVFVVEQQSPYQEVDDSDKDALHIWLADDEGAIAAYARVLPPAVTHPTHSIGRVIAVKRGVGLGKRIMEEAIRVAQKEMGPSPSRLRYKPAGSTRSWGSCKPLTNSTMRASLTSRCSGRPDERIRSGCNAGRTSVRPYNKDALREDHAMFEYALREGRAQHIHCATSRVARRIGSLRVAGIAGFVGAELARPDATPRKTLQVCTGHNPQPRCVSSGNS